MDDTYIEIDYNSKGSDSSIPTVDISSFPLGRRRGTHIYIHACMHIYKHTYIYTYVHISIYIHHIYIYIGESMDQTHSDVIIPPYTSPPIRNKHTRSCSLTDDTDPPLPPFPVYIYKYICTYNYDDIDPPSLFFR
jgi:hypothetical protein